MSYQAIKKLLLAVIILSFSIVGLTPQVFGMQFLQNHLLHDSSLQAYYSFNAGNSTDYTGNHNGSDTAMSYGTAYGKYGQGAACNGSSSFIAIPSFNMGTSYTVSVWVYPTTSGGGMIIARDVAGNRAFYIDTGAGNPLTYYELYAFDVNSTIYDAATTTGTIPLNVWTNLTGVFQSGTSVRIYKNGNLVATAAGTPGNAINTTNAIDICRREYSGSNIYFPGYIDDVEFFNRALTDTEIQDIYTSRRISPGIAR